MKKSILTLLALTLITILSAQSVHDDFEGNGSINTWFGDDCDININFANPFVNAENPSAVVLRYHDTGGQYANVRFQIADHFDLTAKNTFSLRVYVPSAEVSGSAPQQISLKLQDGDLSEPWVTQSEIIKPIEYDAWQTVTFNFAEDDYLNLDGGSPPPVQRSDFNRVVIQVNGENNNEPVLAYLDNVDYYLTETSEPVFDHLVWSDEFDTDGAIDAEKWHHQTQLPSGGSWYNGEIQHYTDRTENSSVADGKLSITARKETFTDQGHTKEYTSARLNSKFAFQYGRVEIRAKLPFGVGTWPALWMLGKNINEDGAYWDNLGFDTSYWPACGEIDIMEHWGHNQNYVQSATHTPSSFGATVNHGGQTIPTASTEFHVYALDWTAEKLVFSVDGNVHYTYNPEVKNPDTWPFDAEQYLLLNVAILPSISAAFTESAMEIDYVRVYQEGTTAVAEAQNATVRPVFYPNPVRDYLTIELNEPSLQETTIFIADATGRTVGEQSVHREGNNLIINSLGDLPAGVYFISFTAKKERYGFRVVKE